MPTGSAKYVGKYSTDNIDNMCYYVTLRSQDTIYSLNSLLSALANK